MTPGMACATIAPFSVGSTSQPIQIDPSRSGITKSAPKGRTTAHNARSDALHCFRISAAMHRVVQWGTRAKRIKRGRARSDTPQRKSFMLPVWSKMHTNECHRKRPFRITAYRGHAGTPFVKSTNALVRRQCGGAGVRLTFEDVFEIIRSQIRSAEVQPFMREHSTREPLF